MFFLFADLRYLSVEFLDGARVASSSLVSRTFPKSSQVSPSSLFASYSFSSFFLTLPFSLFASFSFPSLFLILATLAPSLLMNASSGGSWTLILEFAVRVELI